MRLSLPLLAPPSLLHPSIFYAIVFTLVNMLQGTNLSHPGSSGLVASFLCDPAVFRLSPGLVHTTTMAAHLWKEREDDRLPAAILLQSHYILCNDTLDDIHFGQVATGEDILLPSNSCTSYSWRSHKATQLVCTQHVLGSAVSQRWDFQACMNIQNFHVYKPITQSQFRQLPYPSSDF